MMSETYSDLISKYKKLKKQYLSHKNLQPIKVAILSGSTIGHIKLLLELALLKEGISPEFHEGQYNNYYEEGAFDNPSLKAFNPDYVYIHTTSRNIDFNDTNVIYDRLTQVWDNISNKYGAVIIQNNFEPLPYRLLGNSDVYYNKGRHYAINALNERLYSHARNNTNFYINDINYICAMYGGEKWWNDDIWYAFKYALDLDAVPLLCANITKIIKSVMGFNKKALILDLDNTLWGGIIGEDGIDGIQLGDETPEGMAYRDLQNYLKDLS
ncbi:MAG: HAD family hydrolase, partial [Defluviitaleaceae bacterium]|nr:HAD family hydrolase [Defluviitaleaceae bacterium]